jgi:hypothetical protein
MNDDMLDRGVREAIEPDAEAVRRLLQKALRPHSRTRSIPRPAVAAAGLVLLLAGAAVLLDRGLQRPPPAPVRMLNVGETIVVKPAAGGIWLVGADGTDADRLPAGTIIVYRAGEGR